MKASEWLVRATQDLPAGVTARVKADTLAHLQDAGVDEAADVRPLLGRPDDMAAELRRLYFTEKEWGVYCPQDTRSSRVFGWLTGLFWPVMLIWSLFESRSPLSGDSPLWWGCALIVAGFLLLTQWLHPALRRLWREASLSVGFPLVTLSLTELSLIYHLVAVGLLVQVFFTLWKRNARLARTVRLEGEQA